MIPKRIPSKAKFAGKIYKVKRVKSSKMPTTDDPETHHVGYCDCEQTTIMVSSDLSPEAQRGAYEHEAGHAAAEESGAREIMAKFTQNYSELEEHLVRVWLPCYLDALRTKV